MALDLVNTTNVPELVSELGRLGKWMQAIGIIVIAWLIFQIISLIINLQKKKMLQKISEDIRRLERKVDGLKKRR